MTLEDYSSGTIEFTVKNNRHSLSITIVLVNPLPLHSDSWKFTEDK